MVSWQGRQAFLWISQTICVIQSSVLNTNEETAFSFHFCDFCCCGAVVIFVCLCFLRLLFLIGYFCSFLIFRRLLFCLFVIVLLFFFVSLSVFVVAFCLFFLHLSDILRLWRFLQQKVIECIENAISAIRAENVDCNGLRQIGLIRNQVKFKSGHGSQIEIFLEGSTLSYTVLSEFIPGMLQSYNSMQLT